MQKGNHKFVLIFRQFGSNGTLRIKIAYLTKLSNSVKIGSIQCEFCHLPKKDKMKSLQEATSLVKVKSQLKAQLNEIKIISYYNKLA